MRNIILKFEARILVSPILLLFGILSEVEQPISANGFPATPDDLEPVKAGDLIISNFGSCLDLLWYESRFRPIFALPYGEGSGIYARSAATLFIDVISGQKMLKGKSYDLPSLISFAQSVDRPIVVFLESKPSDGISISAFGELCHSNFKFDGKVHIYGVCHFPSIVSPYLLGGSQFVRVVMLLGRLFSGIKIMEAVPDSIPACFPPFDARWAAECQMVESYITQIPIAPKQHAD